MTTAALNVHSIFESISGEAGFIPQGAWTTFIRFQGCNLRCSWCDTIITQSMEGGTPYINPIPIVQAIKTKNVLITGGEPLIQDQETFLTLLELLYINGHVIQIETNGSLPLPEKYWLSKYVGWVVDYKCPSSGMTHHMTDPETFYHRLKGYRTMLKFVIADDADFIETKKIMRSLRTLGYPGKFILSPADASIELMGTIVQSIRESIPEVLDNIIFSLQLHKFLDLP